MTATTDSRQAEIDRRWAAHEAYADKVWAEANRKAGATRTVESARAAVEESYRRYVRWLESK